MSTTTGEAMLLELYCPKMPIVHLSGRHYRTALEPMRATATMPGGSKILVENVIIPETPVFRSLLRFPLVAMVARCTGQDVKGLVVSELPEERVEWVWSSMGIIAREMIAPTTFRSPFDGSVWKGNVVYPDCPVKLLGGGAQSLTATGWLYKQG
jgi:hypothetical protein